MASPPPVTSSPITLMSSSSSSAGSLTPIVTSPTSGSQFDVLLTLPPERLKQLLQTAVDTLRTADSAPQSGPPSTSVPESALLNGGIVSSIDSGEQ